MEVTEFNVEQELDLKTKHFINIFIFSVEFQLVYFTALFYVLNLRPLVLLDFLSLLFIGYFHYFLTKIKIENNISIQIGFYLFILLIYIHLLLLAKNFPVMYLEFFILPLAVFILSGIKSAIYWAIAVVVLAISVNWVAPIYIKLFNISLTVNISHTKNLVANYSIIITSIYFVSLLLYFFNEFNNIKIKKLELIKVINEKENNFAEEKQFAESGSNIKKEDDLEKFKELYEEIVRFFNENKPYKDPDYNIHKLAINLNTNATYIYKAIKNTESNNFKNFLNQYRIREIKEKLKNKEHEKYTLKHIYNNAGFIHQVTFNRVFKEIEGITPSEFIEKQ